MTVSEEIVALFERVGIGTVFGVPCEQLESYYGSLAGSDVRHVLARSEASAAMMADGFARTGGQVGICDGVGGPGATYLSVGLIEAAGASSPVLALTGDNPRRIRGREVIQDADNGAIMAPHVAASYDPERPDRVLEAVANALRMARSAVPGPTHVNLPEDLLDAAVPEADTEGVVTVDASVPPGPDASRIERVADLLAVAEAPVLLCGEGAVRAGAFDPIRTLAHTVGAPVVTSINGKGIVAETDPAAVGVAGRWGYSEVANDALASADTILGLGCRFGDLTTVGQTLVADDATLVHVDLDPAWLGHTYDVDVPIQADVRATTDALLEVLAERDVDQNHRLETWAAAYDEWRASFETVLESRATPVKPQRVITEIHEATPPETILVSATSFPGFFTGAFYQVRSAGPRYIQARGSDGINYCLPQALGAQVANPDTPVVAVSGDGGIGYHIADLETAAREGLPVTVIVFNNAALGSSAASMLTTEGVSVSTDFHPGVDYAAVAKGLGCRGRVLREPAAVAETMAEAIDSDEPWLLDVRIDQNTFPPVLMD